MSDRLTILGIVGTRTDVPVHYVRCHVEMGSDSDCFLGDLKESCGVTGNNFH